MKKTTPSLWTSGKTAPLPRMNFVLTLTEKISKTTKNIIHSVLFLTVIVMDLAEEIVVEKFAWITKNSSQPAPVDPMMH